MPDLRDRLGEHLQNRLRLKVLDCAAEVQLGAEEKEIQHAADSGDPDSVDLREVREFSAATSQDLAMLTAVVEASTLDDCYITQMLGLANDLAFQLQQSVTLICEVDVEHG